MRQAWGYAWSSAAVHVGQQPAPAWLDEGLWKSQWTAAYRREILWREQDQALLARVGLSTHRSQPLATERMLVKLESELGRQLRPLPVGRPRKPAADEALADAAKAKGKSRRRPRGRKCAGNRRLSPVSATVPGFKYTSGMKAESLELILNAIVEWVDDCVLSVEQGASGPGCHWAEVMT